jgi:hypothetical protein
MYGGQSRIGVVVNLVIGTSTSTNLTVTPSRMTFDTTVGGSTPTAQSLGVTASSSTGFTASASVQSGGTNWLTISPSGSLTTNRTISVTANPAGLLAGTYQGTITIAGGAVTDQVPVTFNIASVGSNLTVTPSQLTFNATAGGAAPAPQNVGVTANTATVFSASASVQSGSTNWLSISSTGSLTTNQTINLSANPTGLSAGTYAGTVTISGGGVTDTVLVSFVISSIGGGTTSGYKVIGWNDLGMHTHDGKDFSVFSILPPFNTIHAHLLGPTGTLINLNSNFTMTYQSVTDPLSNTINTISSPKTNFWQYAGALGFGSLGLDVGLKGYAMPGTGNTPQAMTFSTTDNTWVATGIPITPYADAPAAPFPVNPYPMMKLTAHDTLGNVVATTSIVVPNSDEMNCAICHASGTGTLAAMPASGWSNLSDPLKDMKHNILKKHDDRYGTGLEAMTSFAPVRCSNCHADNALNLPGVPGIMPLTEAIHSLHAVQIDPVTNQTMDSGTTRETCYRCHSGSVSQSLRGVMGNLTITTGVKLIECQSCHGNLSAVAVATRKGWLDEPNCQSCHTGTAISNSGAIVYYTAFSSGTTLRTAADQTFATNPNTPQSGLSLYRFSQGHGGLQCEACHGSTHAEYPTSVVNDNVQSTNLQGHTGVLAECAVCHGTIPSTVTGGPHGMHPIGSSWVSTHSGVAGSGGATQCQVCHGTDYRGTILSKTLADRTLAGRSFPAGTIISCYSCHNGPGG